MNGKTACKMARAMAGVTEKDHFGSDAFYANGRIFATVWHEKGEVNLKLSLDQQRHFLVEDGEAFAEIDNAWGRQGWTKVHLEFCEQELFAQALEAAWESSAVARKAKTMKTAKTAKKTVRRRSKA